MCCIIRVSANSVGMQRLQTVYHIREISLQCSAGRYLRLSSVLDKLTHEKGKIVVPSPKQNPQDPILSSSQ